MYTPSIIGISMMSMKPYAHTQTRSVTQSQAHSNKYWFSGRKDTRSYPSKSDEFYPKGQREYTTQDFKSASLPEVRERRLNTLNSFEALISGFLYSAVC